MATTSAIFNPTMTINNVAVEYIPNSIKFTPGQGEYNMRVQTSGAGAVQSVFSRNMESALGSLKFSMTNTTLNIDLATQWKNNLNGNAVTLSDDSDSQNPFAKSMGNAAFINDPEVGLGPDGTIEVEFKGDAWV